MKKYVYAMSKSRKDIGAELEQGCDELIMHLMKLRLFPYSVERNHWRKEVAEKLHRVDTFKGSHKVPDANFIFMNSYVCNEPYLQDYLEFVQTSYDKRAVSCDENVLFDDIKEYFYWISDYMSTHRVVPYPVIYSKLKELGF